MHLRRLAAAVVVLAAAGVAGCARDRTAEANALRDDVLRMPGVSAVDLYYDNQWTSGYDVELTVDMFDATPEQVDAVARRIDAAQSGDLADYDPTGIFRVTRTSTLTFTEQSDVADIAPHTAVTRAVEPLMNSVTAHSDGGRVIDLSLFETDADPTTALDELFRLTGDVPFTVTISNRRNDGMIWRVDDPTTIAVKDAAQSRIDALPVRPREASIGEEGITALSLDLPDDAAAYDAIVAAAHATLGTAARPAVVSWELTAHPSAPAQAGWRGRASIGGCDRATQSRDDVDPTARALEERVRARFNHCTT